MEPDGEGPWSSSRASNEITKGSKGGLETKEKFTYQMLVLKQSF